VKTGKLRADEALLQQKLVETRSKAQALIMQGKVSYFNEKQGRWELIEKAGESVKADTQFQIENPFPLDVGRGAQKLRGAFAQWPQLRDEVKGAKALDIGASTGGFSQVLLELGAESVIALDVGRNQLHERIKNDKRVRNLEKTHILETTELQWHEWSVPLPFDLMVTDLSFISLAKVVPHAFAWLKPGGFWLLLVKPQFELDAKRVPKGVVKNESDRQVALEKICSIAREIPGFASLEHCDCPLPGTEGNKEFLLYLRKKGL
jgi:23S rRNA (cytidine1920-2'-O)/16S rRNA (cytidine1409-2'-O)-methyltransferase